MAILYKYMSYIDNYLDDPTIKLSPPSLLNDPFESQSPTEMSNYIYNSYLSGDRKPIILNGKEVSESTARKIIENNPINIVHRLGVISLSESNRSLLMWAHYANQHKGIVLGLEDDFLYKELEHYPVPLKLVYQPNPIKISYDTTRFDLTDFENLPESRVEIAKALATKILTTKSDDWIYEKEHRCIVPIGMADKVIYTGKISDRTNTIKKLIARKQIKIDRQTKKVTIENNIDYINSIYRNLSSDEKFLFLKRISPKKIKSIYFGKRVEDSKILKYFECVQKNKGTLGHIKLYKYDLCDKEFRLIKDEVTSKYFTI